MTDERIKELDSFIVNYSLRLEGEELRGALSAFMADPAAVSAQAEIVERLNVKKTAWARALNEARYYCATGGLRSTADVFARAYARYCPGADEEEGRYVFYGTEAEEICCEVQLNRRGL